MPPARPQQRTFDTRDSSITKRDCLSERRRRVAKPAEPKAADPKPAQPYGVASSPAPRKRPRTPAANHRQNEPCGGGEYRVPTPSATHNHLQNKESSPARPRMVAPSRINALSGEHTAQCTPRRESRINSGNNIFGGPTTPPPPPPRTPTFQQRPAGSTVKQPWAGYTDRSDFY